MEFSISKTIFSIWFALSIFGSVFGQTCVFPAIFNFGDSNSDTGGLSAAFNALQLPNGETFFRSPVGRFSDGRLIIDFMAQNLSIPLLSAYLNSLATNYTNGANFATAASTITIPPTVMPNLGGASPFSLDVQYVQFFQFANRSQMIKQEGGQYAAELPPKEYFKQALYTIDIGQNDLAFGFLANRSLAQVAASIPVILSVFSRNVKNIYDLGGRTFWIHNTGPIGCLPYILTAFPSAAKDKAGCLVAYNEVAQQFNTKLNDTLILLRKELPSATFIYVDVYSVKYSLFSDPKRYGGQYAAELPPKEYFKQALYTIDIGQNDLAFGFLANRSLAQVAASIPVILSVFSRNVKNIYDLGGRTFWIHNTGPIGCLPFLTSRYPLAAKDKAGCLKDYNEVAQQFNTKLNDTVILLRKALPSATFIYVDIYSVKYSLFSDPKRYGGQYAAELPPKEYFKQALYTIDIGQNDLAFGFLANRSLAQVAASIPVILSVFSRNVKNIYDLGGRTFWIHNTGPIGCLPFLTSRYPLAAKDKAGCLKDYNEVAQQFNTKLNDTVILLRKALPSATFIYVDIYSVKYSLFSDPKRYGFELPLVSCCGFGGLYNYSSLVSCGLPTILNPREAIINSACDNPSVRVVWDGVHYTEAANNFVFDKIATGAFSDPPIPLHSACRNSTTP